MLVVAADLYAYVARKLRMYRGKVFAYRLCKRKVGLEIGHLVKAGAGRALSRAYNKHYPCAFFTVYSDIIRRFFGIAPV